MGIVQGIIEALSKISGLISQLIAIFKKSTQEKIDQKNETVDEQVRRADETGRP